MVFRSPLDRPLQYHAVFGAGTVGIPKIRTATAKNERPCNYRYIATLTISARDKIWT